MQELKIGEEVMYDRKYDFVGYIDGVEVGENSNRSNVAQNKDGCCNKEKDTEKLSSAAKGREVEGQHIKVETIYNLVCGVMLTIQIYIVYKQK